MMRKTSSQLESRSKLQELIDNDEERRIIALFVLIQVFFSPMMVNVVVASTVPAGLMAWDFYFPTG